MVNVDNSEENLCFRKHNCIRRVSPLKHYRMFEWRQLVKVEPFSSLRGMFEVNSMDTNNVVEIWFIVFFGGNAGLDVVYTWFGKRGLAAQCGFLSSRDVSESGPYLMTPRCKYFISKAELTLKLVYQERLNRRTPPKPCAIKPPEEYWLRACDPTLAAGVPVRGPHHLTLSRYDKSLMWCHQIRVFG